MPRVVAFEDVKANQYRHKECAFNTPFLKSSKATPNLPVAFFTEGDPDRCLNTHWHIVDQFQVVVAGKGTIGRHKLAPYCVHFARAYTPYGPLVSDSRVGLSFFTLRPHFDPGAQYFPGSKEVLKQVPDRRPWQVSCPIDFTSPGGASGTVKLLKLPEVTDDQGLYACSLQMAADSKTIAPEPAQGEGQYLLVVHGSLLHEGKEHKAYTLVYVEPGEKPLPVHAGSDGLDAVIMNFPRPLARAASDSSPNSTAGFRKWQCELCEFTYDEVSGQPSDGIVPGTHWQDVPANWTCPDCSASKSDFRMIEM